MCQWLNHDSAPLLQNPSRFSTCFSVFTNFQDTEEELHWFGQRCDHLSQLTLQRCAALLHNDTAQSEEGAKVWRIWDKRMIGQGEGNKKGPCSLPAFMQTGAPLKESGEAKKDLFIGLVYVHKCSEGERGMGSHLSLKSFCYIQLSWRQEGNGTSKHIL